MMGGLCPRFAVVVHRFGEQIDPDKNKQFWVSFFGFILRPAFHILRFLSVAVCKMVFQEGTELGKDIRFSSKGNIIIGAEKIGNGCVIHHNVTFGMYLAGNDFMGRPKIADNVWVGPNTIIHGNINIGEGATILSGTVLTKNVPPRCVVSGNPGRIVKRKFNNTSLLHSPYYDVSVQTLQNWEKRDV